MRAHRGVSKLLWGYLTYGLVDVGHNNIVQRPVNGVRQEPSCRSPSTLVSGVLESQAGVCFRFFLDKGGSRLAD